MIQNIGPSPKDLYEVVPGLSVCIANCIQTGTVVSSGTEDTFNNIEDVSAISGRIGDVFDAIEYQRNIASTVKNARAAAKKVAANKPAPPAPAPAPAPGEPNKA